MAEKKKHLGFRVPPDTYEKFEEFRGDELSQTDAGRRLLEAGLRVEMGGAHTTGGLYRQLTLVGSVLAALAVAAVVVFVSSAVLFGPLARPLLALTTLLLGLVAAATNGAAYTVGEGWG